MRLEGGRAIVGGRSYDYRVEAGGSDESATPTAGSPVNAEMPGKIVDLKVGVGDSVSEGQALLVMEALKMELDVAAPRAGTVASIAVTKGQQVAAGDLLVSLS